MLIEVMRNYSTEFKSLGSLMDLAKKTTSSEDAAVSNESETSTQVIYEEKDAPRVEVAVCEWRSQ
jgi:hypothetical protein